MARHVFAAACFLCLTASVGRGQITNVTNDQSTPIQGAGHDYIKMLSETVNPANGSVSVRLELPMAKGRALSIPFSVAYDSNGVWHLTGDGNGGSFWISNTTFLSQGGWSYSAPLLSWDDLSTPWFNGGGSCSFTTDYVFQDPSGGRHALGLSYTSDGQGGDGSAACGLTPVPSAGDDLFRASLGAFVAAADGTVFYFSDVNGYQWGPPGPNSATLADYVEDRNGNKIVVTNGMTSTGSNRGAFTYTDTLGRVALSSSGFGSTGNTLSLSGLSGVFTLSWGTASSNFPVNSLFLDPPGGCGAPPTPVSGSQSVVTAITLPNQKSLRLYYDPTYGLLNKVVYPTGGYVRYVWGINPLSDGAEYSDGGSGRCDYSYDTPAIADRYVSFDGANEILHQHFAYSTNWPSGASSWTSKQTTVTTYDLSRATSFQTTYTYAPSGCGGPSPPNTTSWLATPCPVEQTVVYHNWNGSTLRTVNKTWQDVNMLLSESVALDNGLTAETDYKYGAGAEITDKKEFDYGQSPSGTPTRETKINYQNFAATPIYPGPSIFDRPCQIITYDSGGGRAAETDYYYDGVGTLCPTSSGAATGVVQTSSVVSHDYANYRYDSSFPRGNATKKVQVFIGGASNPTTTYHLRRHGAGAIDARRVREHNLRGRDGHEPHDYLFLHR